MYNNLDFSNKDIDSSFEVISISDVTSMLCEPFDAEGVSQNLVDKHYNDEKSDYYHMSKQEILDMWSEKGASSLHYGRLLDDYIGFNLLNEDKNKLEIWKLDNNYDYDERLKGVCESFDNMYAQMMQSGDVKFVAREQTVYYKVPGIDCYIKGRFDALFYNTRLNKYIIDDWKSSGTVDKKPNRYTKKMYGPMYQYPALNWFTYTIQTHFYKKALLENKYLPEGTTPDDVVTLIVQLPGAMLENGQNFEIHREAFMYNSELLDKIFVFAYRKRQLTGNIHQ